MSASLHISNVFKSFSSRVGGSRPAPWPAAVRCWHATAWTPAVDIREEADKYLLHADLPAATAGLAQLRGCPRLGPRAGTVLAFFAPGDVDDPLATRERELEADPRAQRVGDALLEEDATGRQVA